MLHASLSRVLRSSSISRQQSRLMVTQRLNQVIFTSACESMGRVGVVRSEGDSGSNLELKLEKHPSHGGGKGSATNPEELFAAGYSSCFNGALQHQAVQHNIPCGPSTTTAEVSFGTTDSGVGIAVQLFVKVENVQPAVAFQLADLAHAFCPYSKAIDGNIEVLITSKAVPQRSL